MAAISGSRKWPRASDAGCKPALRQANLARLGRQVWVTPSERGSHLMNGMMVMICEKRQESAKCINEYKWSLVDLKEAIAKEWLSSNLRWCWSFAKNYKHFFCQYNIIVLLPLSGPGGVPLPDRPTRPAKGTPWMMPSWEASKRLLVLL